MTMSLMRVKYTQVATSPAQAAAPSEGAPLLVRDDASWGLRALRCWHPLVHVREMFLRRGQGRQVSFDALDGLRALAMMWVLSGHALEKGFALGSLSPWLFALARQSWLGVTVFLVLSGFLVAHVFAGLLEKRTFWPALGVFLWRRFVRIWPALALGGLALQVAQSLLTGHAALSGCGSGNLGAWLYTNALFRAGKECEIPNFKGSSLGRFPLVSADFWTSDHLLERPRSVDDCFGTRARGTLTLKRT